MITIIVAGGQLKSDFLKRQLDAVSNFDYKVIACDGGLRACIDCDIIPDYIVGDFDSAGDELYMTACTMGVPVTRLNPIKDDTDAEACLNLAMDVCDGDIYILGGTGTRLDHVLGNVSMLGLALKKGRRAYLLDENNRVFMMGPGECVELYKNSQYGKYVSVFPYMSEISSLNMKGFKYPLIDYRAEGFTSLTVSNEIADDIASIAISDGYLIVLETRD